MSYFFLFFSKISSPARGNTASRNAIPICADTISAVHLCVLDSLYYPIYTDNAHTIVCKHVCGCKERTQWPEVTFKSGILHWCHTDIEVSRSACLIRLCADVVCMCVCLKDWPCMTTANDRPSIISAKAWDYQELRQGSAAAGPQPGNSNLYKRPYLTYRHKKWGLDYSSIDLGHKRGMQSSFSMPLVQTVFGCCLLEPFSGIVKVFWENPKKSPGSRKKSLHLISNFYKLEKSLGFLVPFLDCFFFFFTLSLCLSVSLSECGFWALTYSEKTATSHRKTTLLSAVAVGGLKTREREKNRTNCKRLDVSHPA